MPDFVLHTTQPLPCPPCPCSFGDKDGSGSDALLQHPLAVLAAPDGTGGGC